MLLAAADGLSLPGGSACNTTDTLRSLSPACSGYKTVADTSCKDYITALAGLNTASRAGK